MLNKKQRQVAQAFFEGQLSLTEIMEKFRLSTVVFERWLRSKEFNEELERLCRLREREMQFTMHRFGPVAVLKLAELLGSDKPDTVRRAAVELIDRCFGKDQASKEATGKEDEAEISDEEAREMVLALAEGMRREDG